MLDENQKIWRYLEFCKFESMLEKKAIFFSKASEMQDKEEGLSPKGNILTQLILQDTDMPPEEKQEELQAFETIDQVERETEKKLQSQTLMTCWRRDDKESPKAWAKYITNGNGVVVQSTYGKFKGCLKKEKYRVYEGVLRDYNQFPEENSIFLEKVIYRNSDTVRTGNRSPYDYMRNYTRKHLDYKWENELRAFLISPSEVDGYGCHIPVDLEYFIENVYVSLKVQNLLEKVKTLTEKCSLKVDVKNSNSM